MAGLHITLFLYLWVSPVAQGTKSVFNKGLLIVLREKKNTPFHQLC